MSTFYRIERDDLDKTSYTKPDYTKGPYPEPHTVDGDPAKKLPPDGTYQPKTIAEPNGLVWQAEHSIGVSYPAGQDFGPYVHRMGEGLSMSFSLDFTNDFPFSVAGVHPHTGIMLFALAFNTRPDVIIETGTQYGYSTFFLAKACEFWGQGMVYTIDPCDDNIRPEIKENPYIKCIKDKSYEALPGLLDTVKQVDIAFIDSWKRLALQEFMLIDPYVVKGGLVIFHDTQFLNTGHTLYDILHNRMPNYDKILFSGTPHVDNGHKYFGNCDSCGLYVMRKREDNPFLDVADANTKIWNADQVAAFNRTDYSIIKVEESNDA